MLIASAMTIVSAVVVTLVQTSPDWLGFSIVPHWMGVRELIGIAAASVIIGPWVIGE